MDYDLSTLSPRSFEQLVQSLAAAVITPGIVVFGDGPDGGREATFDGSMPFPSDASRWHGYLVVQAKFRQVQDSVTPDGTWLLQQVRREIEVYRGRVRGEGPRLARRPPEYFILATNVRLTAAQGSGSKDRVMALLEEWTQDTPLLGYDIWDYDKIRTFLDAEEGIRRAYAAWTTPGDVLSDLADSIVGSARDFDDLLANFLQKEFLSDQFVNLEQAGHTTTDRVPVSQVFVDLPAFAEPRTEPPDADQLDESSAGGFVDTVTRVAAERLGPDPTGATTDPSWSHTARDPKRGRFVLMGGPGQGKTTVGQYVCQLFRASVLASRPPDSIAPEVRDGLTAFRAQASSQGISIPGVRRFPIRVALNHFANRLAEKDGPHTLIGYIVERLVMRTGVPADAGSLRKWLGAYPWLLVLDGLDEVPASSNRRAVLEAIGDFWIDVSQLKSDVLVIATSRPQGYHADFSAQVYEHRWLAPLSPKRALHYAQRLTKVRYAGDVERQVKVMRRLKRAAQTETTRRVMQTPLQVTIMTALVDRVGQPPQERWTLFRDYYDVIYHREVEREIPAAYVLRDYRPDIDAIHKQVALLLQTEGEKSSQTEAKLTTSRFRKVVHQRLTSEGHDASEAKELEDAITYAAAERLVFLVGLEAGEVGFEIRSLQEFMAAEGVMDAGDNLVGRRLRRIACVPYWRNVFLFAAGKCFAEQQHLRDTTHTIAAELNDSPTDTLARATSAGALLALDLLEDGPARRQPGYARLLAREALRFIYAPPSPDHGRFRHIYTDPMESLFVAELAQALERPVERALGAWRVLLTMADDGHDWAERMVRDRWPRSSDEQRLVIGAMEDPLRSPRLATRVSTGIAVQGPAAFATFPRQINAILALSPHSGWIREAENLVVSGRVSRLSAPVVPTELDGFSMQLARMRDTPAKVPREVRALSALSPKWLPIASGVEFRNAPSAESLATVLAGLARAKESPPLPHTIRSTLPWPLAECIGKAESRDDLMRYARAAEQGELGNSESWLAAEKRWLYRGVTEADVIDASETSLPFNAHIRDRGFPMLSASWKATTRRLEAPAELLRRWHRACSQDATRTRLAQFTLALVAAAANEQRGGAQRQSVGALIAPNEFARLVFDSSQDDTWEFPDGSLAALDFRERPSDLVFEAFAIIGALHRKRSSSPSVHPTVLSRLISWLSMRPDNAGLTFVIAWAASPRDAALAARLSAVAQVDSPGLALAELIALPSLVDKEPLAERLARCADLEFRRRTLTILRHKLDLPGADRFVLNVGEHYGWEPWWSATQVLALGTDLLRRRTSGFSDPTTWRTLGFVTEPP
jgi:hypothetical protein